MSPFPRHEERLNALAIRGRARQLTPAAGKDFASNDYLGLADGPILQAAIRDALARDVPIGATGSRLLRGNHPEHLLLEQEAARFFGSESALYMGGGFQANQAVFSSLPMAGDLVLHDVLIHASAHEGMRLGRAEIRAFDHNDINHAETQILAWRHGGGKGQVWIALETVYSMEGDFAPISDFVALATHHDAVLILDEAHSTGLYGPAGRGLAPMKAPVPVIAVHTCGKALGASGALICANRVLTETLINRARPFIFATAPSPLMAAAVRCALRHLNHEPAVISGAAVLRSHAHQAAQSMGLTLPPSQILPVVLGEDKDTLNAARNLQNIGFDVRAIRPPTVPKGTARLRISITGKVTPSDIDELFAEISKIKIGQLQ